MIKAWVPIATFLAGFSSAWPATDLTFYTVSDVHYGQAGAEKQANRKKTVEELNSLPGKHYPASVGGGPVAAPRGVLIPGDLVEWPEESYWKEYLADYGGPGEVALKFPVYDGLGNHDVWSYGKLQYSSYIRDEFRRRSAKKKDLIRSDFDHFHYSWDWDGVHFVNLDLFGGESVPNHPIRWDGFGANKFLKEDLEAHVGTSGRPVFVMQHFPFQDDFTYWSQSEREALVKVLSDYNCIGILHGHTHNKKLYGFQGLDIYDDGTAMKADMMVFRITEGRMFGMYFVRLDTDRGTVQARILLR